MQKNNLIVESLYIKANTAVQKKRLNESFPVRKPKDVEIVNEYHIGTAIQTEYEWSDLVVYEDINGNFWWADDESVSKKAFPSLEDAVYDYEHNVWGIIMIDYDDDFAYLKESLM